jgi:hypothetical protein
LAARDIPLLRADPTGGAPSRHHGMSLAPIHETRSIKGFHGFQWNFTGNHVYDEERRFGDEWF